MRLTAVMCSRLPQELVVLSRCTAGPKPQDMNGCAASMLQTLDGIVYISVHGCVSTACVSC